MMNVVEKVQQLLLVFANGVVPATDASRQPAIRAGVSITSRESDVAKLNQNYPRKIVEACVARLKQAGLSVELQSIEQTENPDVGTVKGNLSLADQLHAFTLIINGQGVKFDGTIRSRVTCSSDGVCSLAEVVTSNPALRDFFDLALSPSDPTILPDKITKLAEEADEYEKLLRFNPSQQSERLPYTLDRDEFYGLFAENPTPALQTFGVLKVGGRVYLGKLGQALEYGQIQIIKDINRGLRFVSPGAGCYKVQTGGAFCKTPPPWAMLYTRMDQDFYPTGTDLSQATGMNEGNLRKLALAYSQSQGIRAFIKLAMAKQRATFLAKYPGHVAREIGEELLDNAIYSADGLQREVVRFFVFTPDNAGRAIKKVPVVDVVSDVRLVGAELQGDRGFEYIGIHSDYPIIGKMMRGVFSLDDLIMAGSLSEDPNILSQLDQNDIWCFASTEEKRQILWLALLRDKTGSLAAQVLQDLNLRTLLQGLTRKDIDILVSVFEKRVTRFHQLREAALALTAMRDTTQDKDEYTYNLLDASVRRKKQQLSTERHEELTLVDDILMRLRELGGNSSLKPFLVDCLRRTFDCLLLIQRLDHEGNLGLDPKADLIRIRYELEFLRIAKKLGEGKSNATQFFNDDKQWVLASLEQKRQILQWALLVDKTGVIVGTINTNGFLRGLLVGLPEEDFISMMQEEAKPLKQQLLRSLNKERKVPAEVAVTTEFVQLRDFRQKCVFLTSAVREVSSFDKEISALGESVFDNIYTLQKNPIFVRFMAASLKECVTEFQLGNTKKLRDKLNIMFRNIEIFKTATDLAAVESDFENSEKWIFASFKEKQQILCLALSLNKGLFESILSPSEHDSTSSNVFLDLLLNFGPDEWSLLQENFSSQTDRGIYDALLRLADGSPRFFHSTGRIVKYNADSAVKFLKGELAASSDEFHTRGIAIVTMISESLLQEEKVGGFPLYEKAFKALTSIRDILRQLRADNELELLQQLIRLEQQVRPEKPAEVIRPDGTQSVPAMIRSRDEYVAASGRGLFDSAVGTPAPSRPTSPMPPSSAPGQMESPSVIASSSPASLAMSPSLLQTPSSPVQGQLPVEQPTTSVELAEKPAKRSGRLAKIFGGIMMVVGAVLAVTIVGLIPGIIVAGIGAIVYTAGKARAMKAEAAASQEERQKTAAAVSPPGTPTQVPVGPASSAIVTPASATGPEALSPSGVATPTQDAVLSPEATPMPIAKTRLQLQFSTGALLEGLSPPPSPRTAVNQSADVVASQKRTDEIAAIAAAAAAPSQITATVVTTVATVAAAAIAAQQVAAIAAQQVATARAQETHEILSVGGPSSSPRT